MKSKSACSVFVARPVEGPGRCALTMTTGVSTVMRARTVSISESAATGSNSEPALRERRLLPALQALVAGGHVDARAGDGLAQAYRFLRRLENRLQMLGDRQTHALPQEPVARARIADGLGYAGWPALRAELDAQRVLEGTASRVRV